MPEESSNGYKLSSVSATLIQSQRCPQHFGTVLRLIIGIGRSPLQNTSHKEGRTDGLSLDERSAKFRPSLSFFSAGSKWQVACIAVCVGWEEVRLPEQVVGAERS
jgi:hypothetical protein